MLRTLGLVLAALFCCSAHAWAPPPFPRIGGIQIGSPFNYDSATYAAQLAKQSVMVLNNYPGMAPDGMPMATAMANIKKLNPNALIFLYTNINNVSLNVATPTSTDWGPYDAQLSGQKWWLYSDAAFTQQVDAGMGDTNDWQVNITMFTPKDAQGDIANEYMARFNVNYSTTQAGNPPIDGLYTDNFGWRPYVNGDWNRDGVVDLQTTPAVQQWFRAGYQHYLQLVEQLMPGKLQIANIGDWGESTSTLTEYQGLANGGVLEAYIGKTWSIETTAGWATTLAQYRKVMANTAAPQLVIFNQWGALTDYQSMRYGLATCLLDNGYYSFTNTAAGYYGVVWFDEMNASLGARSTTGVPQAAWQKGVWRADFVNGIALVNPKGNGVQTVTLEAPYQKLTGTQAPTINSGATVTTVTLQDRDGIILLRTAAPSTGAAPGVPTNVAVTPH